MFEVGSFSIGALVGIIFGAILGHVLAIRRLDYQSRQVAANDLKVSFQYCLVELRKDANPEILASAHYDQHRDKAISYLAHLAGNKRIKFERSLNEYTEWRKKSQKIAAESPRNSSELIGLIENILKYT
jgi:hypothetical protein